MDTEPTATAQNPEPGEVSGLANRPGTPTAPRPLHFFLLLDCSGSMAADGKMPALNVALQEMVPHLREVPQHNPHARLLIRVVGFSTGARWEVEEPTPIEDFAWSVELDADGRTDLGAAIRLVLAELKVPPMPDRALPPVIVLVSDGMATDDYTLALADLMEEPWGRRSVRLAVGIGRDVDEEMLLDFMGRESSMPILKASEPEQLIRGLQMMSTHAARMASDPGYETPFAVLAQDSDSLAPEDQVW